MRSEFSLIAQISLLILLFNPYSVQAASASEWQEDSGQPQSGQAEADSQATAQKSSGLTLKGQVQHTDKLEPTNEELRPGLDFRPASLPSLRETSEWYRVPKWFAGTFKVDESVVVKSYEYLTGKTTFLNQKLSPSGQETRGYQVDAHFDIWHLSTTSGTSRSEDALRVMYNIVHWYGPEEIGEGRVVMRILATTIVVGKKTGKIEGVFRREDIKTYVPLKPGVVSVSYTSKSFNTKGIPLDLQTGFSVHKQIAKFQPVKQLGETDLCELFRQFLESNGLSQLVPVALKKGSAQSWKTVPLARELAPYLIPT